MLISQLIPQLELLKILDIDQDTLELLKTQLDNLVILESSKNQLDNLLTLLELLKNQELLMELPQELLKITIIDIALLLQQETLDRAWLQETQDILPII